MRHSLAIVAFGGVFLLAGTLALYEGSLLGVVFVAIGSLIALAGVAQIRVRRKLRQFAEQRQRSGVQHVRPPRVAAQTPPAPVTIIEHRLAEGPSPSGESPEGLSTLFLWVFDHSPTMPLVQRLKRAGPVYLLRGGGYFVDDMLDAPKMAFGKIDRFIEETREEIDARMATFQDGDRNWLGDYPTFSMICSDDVWTFAIDRMLERAAAIVIDLSDFKPGHAGIDYEIGVVIDRVPLGRVIFVSGPDTDNEAFKARLESLWNTMPETSPNYTSPCPPVHLVVTTLLDVKPLVTSPNASEMDEALEEEQDAILAEQERELDMIVRVLADITSGRR